MHNIGRHPRRSAHELILIRMLIQLRLTSRWVESSLIFLSWLYSIEKARSLVVSIKDGYRQCQSQRNMHTGRDPFEAISSTMWCCWQSVASVALVAIASTFSLIFTGQSVIRIARNGEPRPREFIEHSTSQTHHRENRRLYRNAYRLPAATMKYERTATANANHTPFSQIFHGVFRHQKPTTGAHKNTGSRANGCNSETNFNTEKLSMCSEPKLRDRCFSPIVITCPSYLLVLGIIKWRGFFRRLLADHRTWSSIQFHILDK